MGTLLHIWCAYMSTLFVLFPFIICLIWIHHYYYPLFSECAAGYYRNGDDCEMCTGLSIKMDAGDDTNCSTECTGISDIPNTNHTTCSKLCQNTLFKLY